LGNPIKRHQGSAEIFTRPAGISRLAASRWRRLTNIRRRSAPAPPHGS
jgi:hypothetical protein